MSLPVFSHPSVYPKEVNYYGFKLIFWSLFNHTSFYDKKSYHGDASKDIAIQIPAGYNHDFQDHDGMIIRF